MPETKQVAYFSDTLFYKWTRFSLSLYSISI